MVGKKVKTPARNFGMTGTKWDLFVAAVNLFSTKGYSNVSIRDIASTLNIKAASMYNYFDSKDALLLQIYDFCQYHFDNITANLDNLIDLVPQIPPQQIFEKYLSFFGDEIYGLGLYELMPKVLKIILEEASRDKRAEQLVVKLYYHYPKVYLRPILQKMLELDLIEPIDIDLFLKLYCGLEQRGSLTHGSKLAMSGHDWRKSRRLLFDMIQVK